MRLNLGCKKNPEITTWIHLPSLGSLSWNDLPGRPHEVNQVNQTFIRVTILYHPFALSWFIAKGVYLPSKRSIFNSSYVFRSLQTARRRRRGWASAVCVIYRATSSTTSLQVLITLHFPSSDRLVQPEDGTPSLYRQNQWRH